MVVTPHPSHQTPIDIEYAPQRGDRQLPVEVLDRSELMGRLMGRELASRQRAGFHQLIVCTAGEGTHNVDFETVRLSAGTLLRVYPGQVQQFVRESVFEARMVIWPVESHPADLAAAMWYPGSTVPTRWHVGGDLMGRVLGWVDELRAEQDRFDGSPPYIGLMQALLHSMLLRVAIEIPQSVPDRSHLPTSYLDYRQLIEERLYQRPTVVTLAETSGTAPAP